MEGKENPKYFAILKKSDSQILLDKSWQAEIEADWVGS